MLFGCFTVGQRWLFYCRSRCCLVVLLQVKDVAEQIYCRSSVFQVVLL